MVFPSFARVRRFGRRSVGGHATIVVAGLAAAAALALLLLLLPLLADLFATRGTLVVEQENRSTIVELGLAPVDTDRGTQFENAGMLPLVWRMRNSNVGPTLLSMYSSLPWLRRNQSCLATLVIAGWLLSVAAAGILFWLSHSIRNMSAAVAGVLRRRIHAQTHQLGAGDLFIGQNLSTFEMFTDLTEAVRAALFAWWWMIPHAACFAVLMLLLALATSFWLALATILSAAVSWWLLSQLRQWARTRAALWTDRAGHHLSALVHQLRHNRLLSNLVQHHSEGAQTFDDELIRFQATELRQQTTASLSGPLVLCVVLVGSGLVLLLAGFNVLQTPPRLSFAQIVLLCSALMATAYPLICFERLLERLPHAEQAAADIFAFLDREPRVGQLPDAAPLERLGRQIRLEQVTLADMKGRLLLDNVSCTLVAGQQVVLFSNHDATPLALAGMLPRFCDPAAGQILFDGRDLRSATLQSVRDQVALILPDHILASGTLADNLVGDHDQFTDDELIAALKRVHAYDFVQALPEGLKTVIGPEGTSLSVGQAIGVALARVVLRRPSVVVIAEPRENLDQATAEQIADALEQIARSCTTMVLARRLATLRSAQRILLFHKGQLVADGKHQELLQRDEWYRHLNYVRFNEFRDKFA